jgi:hypothetical protein
LIPDVVGKLNKKSVLNLIDKQINLVRY